MNDLELHSMSEDLRRIQANLIAPKNQRNDFAKFNYRSCEDIFQAVKPLLEELGCTLTLTDEITVVGAAQPGVVVKNPRNDEMDIADFNTRVYVKAIVTFTDSKGGITKTEAFAREPAHKKGMDEMQITGAASSYARKYALSGLFLLDDNKDSDSVLNITEAEIDAFTDLIEGEHAAKLFLMQANDTDKYLALVKAATPKAGKVAFKENLRELIMSAVASAQTTAGYLKEMIGKDDAHGIQEAVEELTPDEKQIVWRQLNPQEQDHVREIMK
jgi:hypothetical protein